MDVDDPEYAQPASHPSLHAFFDKLEQRSDLADEPLMIGSRGFSTDIWHYLYRIFISVTNGSKVTDILIGLPHECQ